MNSKITILIEPDQESSLYQPVLVRGNFFSEFPFSTFLPYVLLFLFSFGDIYMRGQLSLPETVPIHA